MYSIMNRYSIILVLTTIVCNQATVSADNVTVPYKDEIVGLTETHIYTPGYEEGRDYWENMTRDYRLTTNYVNHTLVLQLHFFVLEADKNGDCFYDKLTIYDGYNETSNSGSVEKCGNKTGDTYTSTGNVLYLVFKSDASTNYRGFDIGVRSYGPTTTTRAITTPMPITTTETTASPSSSTSSTTSTTTLTTIPTTSTSTPDTDNKTTTFIIVGAAVGGLLLLILLLVLIICLVKSKKRPKSATSADSNTKRVLWSRGGTKVIPIDFTKTAVPPGEVVQTNIFDMDLPNGHGKANLLPPLSVRLPE